jgi:hypothetical protein
MGPWVEAVDRDMHMLFNLTAMISCYSSLMGWAVSLAHSQRPRCMGSELLLELGDTGDLLKKFF